MKSGEDYQASKDENNLVMISTNGVTHTAMGIMALLRKDKKKALQQVKQLVKMNKDMACSVLTCDVDGWTPVHACVLRGSKKLLKVMLQSGISVNSKMGQPEGLPGDCSLLHIAANRLDKKMLDYLLHHGADVNARDSDGNTALFYAKQSNKDSVRLLINCGAVLNDSGSDPCYHNHPHHRPQKLCSHDTTRQLHHSSPNLKEDQSQMSKTDKYFRQHKQPSQRHWPKEKSPCTNSAGNSSTGKSHFLTVPPTKSFASSPCLLHQEPSSASLSAGVASCLHHVKVSSKESKNGSKISNNNNKSITDLNSCKLQQGSDGSGSGTGDDIKMRAFSSDFDKNISD